MLSAQIRYRYFIIHPNASGEKAFSFSVGIAIISVFRRQTPETEENMAMNQRSTQPTMKDVAREAGVSLGTVSKVINGIPVGEAYRLRVEAAIQRLGYHVNNYARGLKTNKTNVAAVLMPSLRHPFFAALTDEITACLMRHGYRSLLMITNYDPEAERKCFIMGRQNKVDGIIALTYSPDLEADDSIPVVSIDRHLGTHIPCISSDNYRGGQLAAEKLLELGCRKLLFLRIGPHVLGEADKRGPGFEDVCRLRNADYETLILHDEDTEAPFFAFLRGHIHDGVLDYDGIFCNSDGLAVQVCDFLRREGIDVPGVVQIIGFDGIRDFPAGKLYCSTIEQPLARIAETAVSLLLQPDRVPSPASIALPVRYVPGGTTRDAE